MAEDALLRLNKGEDANKVMKYVVSRLEAHAAVARLMSGEKLEEIQRDLQDNQQQ